jgi:hypothetical protein
MSDAPTSIRATAQTLLRRLFVAFILPWAFISAQAASAHIAPVPVDTVLSAAAGKTFVVDVRTGVAAVKAERPGAQPGKSSPPLAIVGSASRMANGGTPQSVSFASHYGAPTVSSAPSGYWSRGPPLAALAFRNIKSI